MRKRQAGGLLFVVRLAPGPRGAETNVSASDTRCNRRRWGPRVTSAAWSATIRINSERLTPSSVCLCLSLQSISKRVIYARPLVHNDARLQALLTRLGQHCIVHIRCSASSKHSRMLTYAGSIHFGITSLGFHNSCSNHAPRSTAGCCHLANLEASPCTVARLLRKFHDDSCNCFPQCCNRKNNTATHTGDQKYHGRRHDVNMDSTAIIDILLRSK